MGTPVNIEGANAVFNGGGPIRDLPAKVYQHASGHEIVVSKWRLTPAEIAIVLKTGCVHLSVLPCGQPLQPARVTAIDPYASQT